MCGIGGVLFFNGSQGEEQRLEAMSLAMTERGPDDHGVYFSDSVALVHRRLSIIDLSASGRCPMGNEDGNIQITFNGEIYNHLDLRKTLKANGHTFKSSSDTEVIIHGYEEWGVDVVQHLDGMFAFAIWDNRKKQLFMARDRVGEKPLYYKLDRNSLVFASSVNALHSYFGNELELNASGLDCFLSHGFIPSAHTIWKSVSCFPPAHRAICKEGGEWYLERYWDFPDCPPEKVDLTEAEARIEAMLESSVAARLAADVPVGGFLSGGVDSSLVMALAAKQRSSISTFSIGFREADYSELPYARRVAEVIGSKHHELILCEDDLLDCLPELIWQLGQPFGDSSVVPTYLLSRFSRKHVKVSLSGDGGDESFAGYWRCTSNWYAGIYSKLLPVVARRSIIPQIAKGLGYVSQKHTDRLLNLNDLSLASPNMGYTNALTWFNQRRQIIGDAPWNEITKHDPATCRVGKSWDGRHNSSLRRLLYDDFQVLLPDDYLTKVDAASMAASLEVRTPLLGHQLLEAAWIMPDNLKLRWGQRKWLLKRIAAKHVPRSVIYRNKMGFAMPMKHWWRGRLANILFQLMSDSHAVEYGWIYREPVMNALQEHVSGHADHSTRLWLILCLELWARLVVAQTLPRSISLRDMEF